MFVCPKCHREKIGEKCRFAHPHRPFGRCDLCKRGAKLIECRDVDTTVKDPQAPPITITAENHPENR